MTTPSDLDPSVSRFFSSGHVLPRDLEECLQEANTHLAAAHGTFATDRDRVNALVDYFMETLPHDDTHVKYGHPTLALIHFFKRDGLHYPSDKFLSMLDVDKYVQKLFTVLLCDIHDCAHILGVSTNRPQWKCPCGNEMRCGALCHVLKARLSVLQLAVEIIELNAIVPFLVDKAYMHIDAHMPLLFAMHNFEEREQKKYMAAYNLSKNNLFHPAPEHRRIYACSDAILESLLVQTPIDIEWAMTDACVPDTSPLVRYAISYNNNTSGMSNKRMLQSKFPALDNLNITRVHKLVNFIYKGLPSRCHNRELWSFIKRCCINTNRHTKHSTVDVELVEFFVKIMVASLLGVYSESQWKMCDINARVRIYTILYVPISLEQVINILHPCNKISLLYIAKEYVREMTSRSPGILEALKKVYDWDVYDRCITTISKVIRMNVQHNVARVASFSLGDLFVGVDGKIVSLHEGSRRSQRENTVNYNVRLILKECNNMNLKSHVIDISDDDDVRFMGREFEMTSPHPTLSKEHTLLMQKIIQTFKPQQWVSFEWLVCFGVSWRDVYTVKSAVFEKMTALLAILRRMKENDPHTYAVFYTFFRLCKQHRDYREYYCDVDMYLNHAVSLNRFHKIDVGDRIPPALGKVLVCPACGDMKRVSFFRPFKRNKNGRGMGIVRICLDGRMVCGRKTKSAGWIAMKNAKHTKRLKQRAAGIEDDDDEEEDEDEDEDDEDDDEDDGRSHAHMNEMDLLRDDDDDEDDGYVIEVKKGKTTMPTERTKRRQQARHIATQHMLNECKDTETVVINTLGRVVEWQQQLLVSCTRCIRTVHLATAMDMGPHKLCQDCYQHESEEVIKKFKCEAPGCTRKIVSREDYRTLLVYDDVGEERRSREMVLCLMHAGFGWLTNGETEMNASFVFRGLSEKWGIKNGPNGKCIEPKVF